MKLCMILHIGLRGDWGEFEMFQVQMYTAYNKKARQIFQP
jgi:hypothetical protein